MVEIAAVEDLKRELRCEVSDCCQDLVELERISRLVRILQHQHLGSNSAKRKDIEKIINE